MDSHIEQTRNDEFDTFKRGIRCIERDNTSELKKKKLELQIERLRNQERPDNEEETVEDDVEDEMDEVNEEEEDGDYVDN